jgi:hypothetical protein
MSYTLEQILIKIIGTGKIMKIAQMVSFTASHNCGTKCWTNKYTSICTVILFYMLKIMTRIVTLCSGVDEVSNVLV